MITAFLLIDLRHKPQTLDLEFMRWLGKNYIPFSIVFTKADKLKELKLKRIFLNTLKHIRKDWEEMPKHFITSSEKS